MVYATEWIIKNRIKVYCRNSSKIEGSEYLSNKVQVNLPNCGKIPIIEVTTTYSQKRTIIPLPVMEVRGIVKT